MKNKHLNGWGNVRGFRPLSLTNNWPGYSSAVLFLGGCNFRCPTCHNHRIAFNPNSEEPVIREKILERLKSGSTLVRNVVITGGEPTITTDLLTIIKDIRDLGLMVKLDSNGSNPDIIKTVLKENLVDAVAIDIKGPCNKYPSLTGNRMSTNEALDCLTTIFNINDPKHKIYYRTTKVPILTQKDLNAVELMVPQGAKHYFQEYIEPEEE